MLVPNTLVPNTLVWSYFTIIDVNNKKAVSYDYKDGKLIVCDFSRYMDWNDA